jgi:TIGR03009 family protein
MRCHWPILPVLLLLPTLALAQQQPAPGANQAQMLKFVLDNWEKSMTKMEHFAATCRRATTDKTFGGKEVYEGWAKFVKSGANQPSRALLYMEKKGEPAKYEKFLYTGAFLYEWVPATKVLRIHDVPQPKAGQPAMEDNILALLFGMKAAQAQQRYEMKWVPDTQNNNKFYHYLQILPRHPPDKADFTEARLVLTSNGFLPRQVWYHQPNGNEITWDFEKVDVTTPIPLTTFAPPTARPDNSWRVERLPQQGAVPASGVGAKK